MSADPPSRSVTGLVRRARARSVGPALRAEALAEMAAWLVLVELGLRTMPVDRLSRLLGVELRTGPPAPAPAAVGLDLTRGEIRRLRALDALVRRRRFAPGPCLRSALVGGRVLRRRHPQLVLGVASREGGVEAHAWLEVSGVAFGRSEAFVPLVGSSQLAS